MKGGSNALTFSYVLQWRTPKGGASITCTEENRKHYGYLVPRVTLHDFLTTD